MAISTKYHLTLLYTGNSMSNPLTKDQVIHKLNATEPERAKQALVKFMQAYITPAFGSLPKREIDIALFQILQELKIFDKNNVKYTTNNNGIFINMKILEKSCLNDIYNYFNFIK